MKFSLSVEFGKYLRFGLSDWNSKSSAISVDEGLSEVLVELRRSQSFFFWHFKHYASFLSISYMSGHGKNIFVFQ